MIPGRVLFYNTYIRPWYITPAISKSAPLRMTAATTIETERIIKPMSV